VAADQPSWNPPANPWAIANTMMIANFMVVLSTSVANVALPHIAGNLSVSNDEATWVLTSYLGSTAIILPATGWLTRRFGRKRLLLSSIFTFTVASIVCGMAFNMPMLIVARVLQGVGGGSIQPLAQSILLESFLPKDHGKAMAMYGTGTVVAPVIGPTLGGWVTDSYSWRWIFYINVPVGVMALFLASLFIEDPPYLRTKTISKVDGLGFALMALWLGTLQLFLDKGQDADWFSAIWIRWTFAISFVAQVGFIARELLTREPIVRLHVLLNRNFSTGTLITGLYGFVLYSATALLPLFLQTLMGYPAFNSGLAVSPRGIGALLSMAVVGVLTDWVEGQVLLVFGFAVLGVSVLMLTQINLGIAMSSVAVPNLINGFASGFIFVPLTTMTMGRLPRQEMGNAAGIYNLMRNIGGSVGVAASTALLIRKGQIHQNYLAANLTGSDPQVQSMLHGLQGKLMLAGSDPVTAQHMALGAMYQNLMQQASLLAYVDNFRLLGVLSLLCIPIAMLFQRVKKQSSSSSNSD
jgi:DHA2 family multidrug resistance protein